MTFGITSRKAGCDCLEQGCEVAFVVTPTPDRSGIHGFADLPVAGGVDRALVLVERKALVVPGESAILNQPAAFGFLALHEFFIPHVKDLAR